MSIQYWKIFLAFLIWLQVGLPDQSYRLLGASIVAWQDESAKTDPKDPVESKTTRPSDQELDFDSLNYASDFESDLDEWEFSDEKAWKLDHVSGSNEPMIRQFSKASDYQPKFRSPLHQAILKDQLFGSFELIVDVRSTHASYGHRDACLFFGYQNPDQFYYVHLGQATDPHCNQIFLVNNADRIKISSKTNRGTPWDEKWHQVRIVRCCESGKIEVYFDDQASPVMTAEDKTFPEGRIGIGSFDDTADWARLRVRKIEPAVKSETPKAGASPATDGQ
jgi:hypothetical protein